MGNAIRNVAASSRPKQNRKYSIIIPAAGLSSRMKKYGPQSLIKINNNTLLDRQIKTIDKVFRWYEIILVGGFEFDKLTRHVPSKVKLIENKEYLETTIIHSINLGLNQCQTENILIMYGDLIFNNIAITAPFDNESIAIISNDMKTSDVGCTINNNYIQQMFYGIDNKWGQIVFITKQELSIMKTFCSNHSNHTKYGFESINYIIESGGKIKSHHAKKSIIFDIDTSLDLKKTRMKYENSNSK